MRSLPGHLVYSSLVQLMPTFSLWSPRKSAHRYHHLRHHTKQMWWAFCVHLKSTSTRQCQPCSPSSVSQQDSTEGEPQTGEIRRRKKAHRRMAQWDCDAWRIQGPQTWTSPVTIWYKHMRNRHFGRMKTVKHQIEYWSPTIYVQFIVPRTVHIWRSDNSLERRSRRWFKRNSSSCTARNRQAQSSSHLKSGTRWNLASIITN